MIETVKLMCLLSVAGLGALGLVRYLSERRVTAEVIAYVIGCSIVIALYLLLLA